MNDFSEEIELDETASIDDFIKELEAREKDLQISPDLVIEIEDSDVEETDSSLIEDVLIFESEEPKTDDRSVVAVEPLSEKPASQNSEAEKKKRIFDLEREVARFKERVAKIETERTELFELSRRRQTDFDNFKKRTERDKQEAFSNQLGRLAGEILPVLDNLDRAMQAASKLNSEKSAEFQKFFDGIVLVNSQLNSVIAEMGVMPIPAVGEQFDPHFHEAVATEESDEIASNTVLEELMRGYLLAGKVIRPSMVKVSKSSTKPAGEPLPASD